jgi:hypothetical protein
VVLFLPGGIVSIPERIRAFFGSKSKKAAPESEPEEEVTAPGAAKPTDAQA